MTAPEKTPRTRERTMSLAHRWWAWRYRLEEARRETGDGGRHLKSAAYCVALAILRARR